MKIGVIGSINMDMVAGAPRIPLKGETLIGTTLDYNAGGKGANQAVAIARLGGSVTMFGSVGNDENGRKLTEIMKNEGINTDFIKVVENENTGLAIITVGDNDNTIIVISGANNSVTPAYIDSIKDELSKYDLIVLQHEIPDETNEYVVKICKDLGIKTLLNPAPARPVSDYMIENVNFITPNEHEAKLIFPSLTEDEALLKYDSKLIITQGENGVSIAIDGKVLNVPCRKSKPKDTTGAGDTFNGAFAYSYINGAKITDALAFANIAAGMSTEKDGAQGGMPTLEMVNLELGGK